MLAPDDPDNKRDNTVIPQFPREICEKLLIRQPRIFISEVHLDVDLPRMRSRKTYVMALHRDSDNHMQGHIPSGHESVLLHSFSDLIKQFIRKGSARGTFSSATHFPKRYTFDTLADYRKFLVQLRQKLWTDVKSHVIGLTHVRDAVNAPVYVLSNLKC